MFKADRPADLSSGKLYAAKWTQDGAADNFKVSWILLGSGEWRSSSVSLQCVRLRHLVVWQTAHQTGSVA
jgi:hypothetical protein